MKKLNKKQLRSLSLGYGMIALAEIYNQNPDDPGFEKFSEKAMKDIKLLVAEIKKRREKGEIE